jgi:C-terminal processing protease CtpA/Prc
LGDEVCLINHQDVDSLEHALFQYVPTEGNMITPKEAFLSTAMNFNFWYAMFISRPDSFDMVFKSPDGKIKKRVWRDSLTFKESSMNTLKNPVNKRIIEGDKIDQRERTDPWRLKIAANKQYAVLTLDGFGNGYKKDQKRMAEKFAGFFAELKKDKIPNLIINLANNPGGDEANAAELFSYLISEPKHFINDEYLITDDDTYLKRADLPTDFLGHMVRYLYPEKDGRYYVKEETQGELPICQPKAGRFTGKLYFYISGRTASAASTFAAVAQSNHLGVFIGEETGGTYFGGGSSVGINMTLPNSGITTHTSINYCDFATTGNDDPNRGVLPDHLYVPTFAELMTSNKGWEEYIVKLMTAHN